MERSEPSLVPEWLRSTGGANGGGNNSTHHFALSQSDGPLLALPKRNRPLRSNGSSDVSLDRSLSSNSRRSSSSNGSSKQDKNSYGRPYTSMSRSQRDRDRDRLEHWDLEYSDPLGSLLNGRSDDTLRRSQSMISRRPGDVLPRRVNTDLRNGIHNSHDNGNGTPTGTPTGTPVAGTQKVSFERDFPLLGSDDRPRTPDILRVSSPGLSRSIQSMSIGNPTLMGSEGWTSALAEAPTAATLQIPVTAVTSNSSSSSGVGSLPSGLNMAEALVQAPSRSQNIPKQSVQTQRDELAIAQSKKLIPMKPSLPKTLVPNSSDKLKPKAALRSSDAAVATKNGVHQLTPLQLGGQHVHGSSVGGDGPKSPSGKLLILKPGRENGVFPALKDVPGLSANVNNRVGNGHPVGVPAASASLKNPNNHKIAGERKAPGFGLNPGPVVEKRSSLQSRNDFFNLLRNQSLNNSSGSADSGTAVSSDKEAKIEEESNELQSAEVTVVDTGSDLRCNGETCTGFENSEEPSEYDNVVVSFSEAEEKFMTSLGWSKDGKECALTQEEIDSFFEELIKNRDSSALCRFKLLKHLPNSVLNGGAGSTEPSAFHLSN